jgi:Polyketide cyclase / dehydrase and lipid transport
MHEVRVHVQIESAVERVFDAVSDHESFLRSEGGVRARVVRAGEPERNGVGCLREVRVGRRVRYVEEIIAWECPWAFEYLIRETSLPLRHNGSRLTFTPQGSGTAVDCARETAGREVVKRPRTPRR